MTPFPGAEGALAAHGAALPQPDQLCGPFAAWVALHAVMTTPPSVVELARAGGTRIWPHDEPVYRPTGSQLVTTGWDELPAAATPEESGTDAAGVTSAVEALTDRVVLPVPGGDSSGLAGVLDELAALDDPIGVLANVRTGPIAPASQPGWDVGHFVVLWGWDAVTGTVGVADTYPEVGDPGLPPGCRMVGLDALTAALAARGLLLLAAPGRADDVTSLLAAHGSSGRAWRT